MNELIYLDNNATTKIDDSILADIRRNLPSLAPSQKLNTENLIKANFEYSSDGTYFWSLNKLESLHLYFPINEENFCTAIIIKENFAISRNENIVNTKDLLSFVTRKINS